MRNNPILQRPAKWISAHRNCVFRFGIPTQMAFGGYNASGYLGIVMTTSFGAAGTPAVGDRLYIYGGTYEGFVTVREVVSTIQFVTESTWVGSMYNEQVGFVNKPTFSVYKGYRVGEVILNGQDLSEWQPYELVGEFIPDVGTDGVMEFDIYEYLKAAMSAPNYGYNQDEENKIVNKGDGEDYIPLNYNKIELVLGGGIVSLHYVANTGLTTNDLNRYYVDTNQPMQPLRIPIDFTGKDNTQDKINGLTQIRFTN